TSPLRSPASIDACVEAARAHGGGSVVTVTATTEILGRLEEGVFRPRAPGQPRRRQLREPLYREVGVAYVTPANGLRERGSVLVDPIYAVVVPEEEAVDINTRLDLALAEAI